MEDHKDLYLLHLIMVLVVLQDQVVVVKAVTQGHQVNKAEQEQLTSVEEAAVAVLVSQLVLVVLVVQE